MGQGRGDDDRRRCEKWPEDKVLGHPIRREVIAMLEEREGGLPATAIYHELDEAPNVTTLRYHLRVLCAHDFIKADRDNTSTPVYVLV